MNNVQRIQLKMSELREQVNTEKYMEIRSDASDAEQRIGERTALTEQLSALEPKLRAAHNRRTAYETRNQDADEPPSSAEEQIKDRKLCERSPRGALVSTGPSWKHTRRISVETTFQCVSWWQRSARSVDADATAQTGNVGLTVFGTSAAQARCEPVR